MAKEITSLTGIRGIAATWVVLYHVHEGSSYSGLFKMPLLHGYLAVDLFFLLSGLVMALSYGHYVEEGWSRKAYGTFLMRRFGRVYPLYFITTWAIALTILAGWSRALPTHGFEEVWIANTLLVQNWISVASINSPAWSISAEFAAYLLFPILASFTLTIQRPIVLLVAVMACFAFLFMLQFVPTPSNVPYRVGPLNIYWGWQSVLRCLSEFTIGLSLFRLLSFAPIREKAAHPVSGYAVAALIVVLLFVQGSDVLIVATMSLLLLTLASGDTVVSKMLGSTLPVFMGDISYSMYLIHSQFLRLRHIGESDWLVSKVGAVSADALTLVVLYISIVFCSWLTYQLIEKPCRGWLRQSSMRPSVV